MGMLITRAATNFGADHTRGAIRSILALENAYLELIQDGFEKITISDVSRKSLVSRATLYVRFGDVEALKNEVFKNLRYNLFWFIFDLSYEEFFSRAESWQETLINEIIKNYDILKALSTKPQADKFLDAFIEEYVKKVGFDKASKKRVEALLSSVLYIFKRHLLFDDKKNFTLSSLSVSVF